MATLRNASTVSQSIPSLNVTVPAGETFECPDDLAAELAERPDFERPKKATATKAEPKTAAPAAEPKTAAPAAEPKTAAPAANTKES